MKADEKTATLAEPIPAGRPGVPNPVDVHVGSRIRLRRTLLGISQEKLGEALGLTFQQVQKYERGTNRVGASRLFDLSRILDVPVQFFFEDMPEEVAGQAPSLRAGVPNADVSEAGDDKLVKRETLELVRAYYRIKKPAVRKRLFELCKAVALSEEEA